MYDVCGVCFIDKEVLIPTLVRVRDNDTDDDWRLVAKGYKKSFICIGCLKEELL